MSTPLKVTSGIHLPNDHPDFSLIYGLLDRTISGWNGTYTRVKFFLEKDDHIIIPRFYPVGRKVDYTNEGQVINIKSYITPRNERQKKAMAFLQNNKSGILKLEPGSGKTIITIDTICKIGKKAIVFVNKDSLRDQWREEAVKFTSLEKEDIGFLSTGTFKKDLKKSIIISTVQAFGAILRTAKRDEFLRLMDDEGVGVAIFDECHTTVGPETFSLCSLNCKCHRVYGLSATPTRSDGNDDILNYHLGEIKYFPPEKDELLDPIIYMIHFPFHIYPKSRRYLCWGGKFDTGRYLSLMHKSPEYNTTVAKLINRMYIKDRNILVLGSRINGLLTLAETCKLEKTEIGIFIPGSISGPKDLEKAKEKLKEISDLKKRAKKRKELKEIENMRNQLLGVSNTIDLKEAFDTKRVVFSTYTACRDGNNRKNLDVLVMSTTCTNIEQAIGRIQRTLDGKPTPIVLDLIDTEGPEVKSTMNPGELVNWYIRSSQKRKAFYEEKGWEVKEFWLK